jgi:hypothetical protein
MSIEDLKIEEPVSPTETSNQGPQIDTPFVCTVPVLTPEDVDNKNIIAEISNPRKLMP